MTNSNQASETRPSGAFLIFLFVTALVCGAAVMVIEVLGSRVVGPFFGVSLFVWTSLICVTLIALAVGYWFGGILADRRGRPADLYLMIAASGLCVLLIPWIKSAVLEASMPLGLRTGAFVSTLLLFGPSLMLLGCVSPYLVKIASHTVTNIGRTVGGLYALSTLGSVAGTGLTGFFLVAHFGVNQAFYAVGVALLVLAGSYFVMQRRFLVTAVAVVLSASLAPQWIPDAPIIDGETEIVERERHDTFYGTVKVVDTDYDGMPVRELLIDGLLQGAQDISSGMSVNRFPYMLQFLPWRLQPQGHDALVVGLGVGFIPRWYSARGVRTDVVDVDPLIPELARKWFGFNTTGDVIVSDARHFLLTTKQQYDYIILDAYSGDLMPHHLVSREMFTLISGHMRPGGVLGINWIGSVGEQGRMTASVMRTLRTTFEHVDVYPAFDVQSGDGVGNLIILAYNGAREPLALGLVPGLEIHPVVDRMVRGFMRTTYTIPDNPKSLVLTDDYNPSDFYDVALREAVRNRILKSTAWGLLTR